MDTPELPPGPDDPEPANLRFLRRLVTILTATMISGVLLIIGLIVIRFYDTPPPSPENISLPDGQKALSFTQGPDWYAIVTDQNMILIFDRMTGQLRQEILVQTD